MAKNSKPLKNPAAKKLKVASKPEKPVRTASAPAGAGKNPVKERGKSVPSVASQIETQALSGLKPQASVAVREAAQPSALPQTVPLTVTVQTSQGHAGNGNTQPANLLVIVTSAGWPVTELDQNHFTLMQHFDLPGQVAPFSNNIVTFRNAGSGAYLLQTRPINASPWRSGHYLGQILVSGPSDQQGQAAFKLVIR